MQTDLTRDPAAIRLLVEAICRHQHQVSAAEARALLDVAPGSEAFQALIAGAQAIRARFHGDRLRCCSIVNVKAGNCSENCSYCAQGAQVPAESYEKTKWMTDEDIATASASSAANGAQAVGLVAAWWGIKEGTQLNMVCETIERFAQNGKVRPDVNLGILENQRCADRIAEAGAKVYGHNLETARSFFDNICTTHSFEERLKTVQYIKKSGMGLCSGGIVGMGESKDQRIEFLEQIRFIEPEMVPINFLNPIAGTKLGDRAPLDPDEALIFLAVARFYLPERNLMAAGGKEVVFKDRLAEVFSAGINAVMVGNYLTTLGTTPEFWQEAAATYGLRLPSTVEAIEDPAAASCGSGGCGCN